MRVLPLNSFRIGRQGATLLAGRLSETEGVRDSGVGRNLFDGGIGSAKKGTLTCRMREKKFLKNNKSAHI